MNLLILATDPHANRHDRAREWFEDQMNGGQRVGLPWAALLGFVRLSTNRAARRNPISMDEALEFVAGWLEWETVWVPEATERHFEILAPLLRAAPRSRMVTDAHLAALAIEHGLTFCSADNDFRVFPDLKFHNPLQ